MRATNGLYGMRMQTRCALLFALGCSKDPSGVTNRGVTERWYQVQVREARARPAILGNIAYFGTGDGNVVGRDRASGTTIWSTRVGGDAISGANIVARVGVVVAASVFSTSGLDAQTGLLLWSYQAPLDTTGVPPAEFQPGTLIDSRMDADDNMVYIPAWGASVSAVDLHSGVVKWVWHLGKLTGDTAQSGTFRSGSMGVRVSGDTVFATAWHYLNRAGGHSEALVIAIDRTSGTELWQVSLPSSGSGVDIEAAPVVYKGLVIAHTLSGATYGIDRSSQQVVWQHVASDASLSTIAGPELHGDTVYVDGGNRHVFALSALDGSILWASAFESATSRDMLVTDRRVVFTNGGTLFIINRLDGVSIAALAQPRSSDPLFASPAAYSAGDIFVSVANAAWCFAEP